MLSAVNLDAYEKVIEVDLLGAVRTIKAALPEIIRNRGYILITASIYAFCNDVINSAYASKAAVEMLGRSLRLELAPEGAAAGVLYPGWSRPRSPTRHVAATSPRPSSKSGCSEAPWEPSSTPNR